MMYSCTSNSGEQMATSRAAQSALHSLVYVTVPNMNVAKEIAKSIVSQKLAACVNIIPSVISIYEWKGKIEEDNELLLVIKTKTTTLQKLKEAVLTKHPYETPEFIASPVSRVWFSFLMPISCCQATCFKWIV
uniref:Divalent-cation tolerance protein CutA n=1 Tax=Syphacia muris TaxID=451379 RepID=A0A0N5B1E3_9BILA